MRPVQVSGYPLGRRAGVPLQEAGAWEELAQRVQTRPDHPNFIEYYTRHPEFRGVDAPRSGWRKPVEAEQMKTDPVGKILSRATFQGRKWLGTTDMVQGKVAPTKPDLDPVIMTRKLKEFGKYMGCRRRTHHGTQPRWGLLSLG